MLHEHKYLTSIQYSPSYAIKTITRITMPQPNSFSSLVITQRWTTFFSLITTWRMNSLPEGTPNNVFVMSYVVRLIATERTTWNVHVSRNEIWKLSCRCLIIAVKPKKKQGPTQIYTCANQGLGFREICHRAICSTHLIKKHISYLMKTAQTR